MSRDESLFDAVKRFQLYALLASSVYCFSSLATVGHKCVEKEDESWEILFMLQIGYKLHMKRLELGSC